MRSGPVLDGHRTDRRSRPGSRGRHAVPVELSPSGGWQTLVSAWVPVVADRLYFNWGRGWHAAVSTNRPIEGRDEGVADLLRYRADQGRDRGRGDGHDRHRSGGGWGARVHPATVTPCPGGTRLAAAWGPRSTTLPSQIACDSNP